MAEPWIRVHANIAGKPVVWRAVEALGVSSLEAVGLLVTFWGAVSQHASNGQVASLPDSQLEAWAGWTRKRGKFAAFIRAHHLDSDGRVNEWDEYAGALEEQRRQSRDRKRKSRGSHSDRHAENGVTSSPTKRNDNDTKRDALVLVDDSASVPNEPELTALFLTICANRAITERWTEQPSPLVLSGAIALAVELGAARVPADVARLSIYEQCRESKQGKPPKHVNYFRPGILTAWEAEQTRRSVASSGEVPPPVASVVSGTGARRESWDAEKERLNREEGERRLVKDRWGNVEQRRAEVDGDAWWARVQREAKAAKQNPVLYAYDRMHEPAELEIEHV